MMNFSQMNPSRTKNGQNGRNEEEMRTTRELEKKLSEATRRSWTRLWMVSVFFFAPLTVFLRYPKVIQLFSVVRYKCNNCQRNLLQNISECYCCQELEGCVKGLGSYLVVAELDPNAAALRCITEHPGFNPVCLQRWSLRLAADKYRTKGKQKYRQTGSEDRWAYEIGLRQEKRGWQACATPSMAMLVLL